MRIQAQALLQYNQMGNVLYRKYRSKNLSEIVGQSHVTTTLKNAIASDRIAHAYLLTGPRGVGKTSVARIIAREVNGLDDDAEQNHLDIIEIDAASNRRIDEIRELREKVHNAPAQAKYKVYIIDEVHMLTKEAFNALLKTLEEPPAHAIFILATTEAHKLPETIISRTQRFTFKSIDVHAIKEHLAKIAQQEDINISDGALELIAKHSSGSFRDSLGLLDQARHIRQSGHKLESQDIANIIGAPSEAVIDELMDATGQSDVTVMIEALQKLLEQGIDASYIAADVSRRTRSAIIKAGAVSSADTRLLKDMTLVPSSPDPFLSLEIALLDYMSTDEAVPNQPKSSQAVDSKPSKTPKSRPAVVNQSKETQEKLIAPKEQATKPKASKNTEKPVEQTSPTDAAADEKPSVTPTVDAADAEAIWAEVLKSLKGAHNTLYGMARMAKPSITNDSFQLECKYAFHVKRLSDNYHNKILEKAIHTCSGQVYQLSCSLASKQPKTKKPERPTVAPQEGDPVETVSNIFGGAEVLES